MTLVIDRVGREGDGLAREAERSVAVPFTLPGERVEPDGTPVGPPSPERVAPVCRHFGTCGNCVLQHWAAAPMLEWKRERVAAAFRRAGLVVVPEATVPVPLGSRRRVTFTAFKDGDAVLLGYHRRRSHDVFAVEECPILAPAIVDALPVLARAAALAWRGPSQLLVTDTANGLDVEITRGRKVSDDERRALSRLAVEAGLARLSVDGEVVVAPRAPVVRFGAVDVEPPPGAFLQATRPSEEAMAALVTGHLAGARRTVDLYAGAGTFALRLAGTVHAVDEAPAALDALARAAARADRDAVTTETRDLDARPLLPGELKRFDAAVLDPPRAGAAASVAHLAYPKLALTRIAYVSCNPDTLAPDAKVLVDAGWRLTRVVPVDQFLYSAHVEAVALFERAKPKRERRLFG